MYKGGNDIIMVALDDLMPHPKQNEIYGDLEPEGSFVDSIKEVGILQPLLICNSELFGEHAEVTANYGIIAGHRRMKAAFYAGIQEIPCIFKEYESFEETEVDLMLSNLHRIKTKKMLLAEFRHYEQISCQQPELLDKLILRKLAQERGIELASREAQLEIPSKTSEKIAGLTGVSKVEYEKAKFINEGEKLQESLDSPYLTNEFVKGTLEAWEQIKKDFSDGTSKTNTAYVLCKELIRKASEEVIKAKAKSKAFKAVKEELESRKKPEPKKITLGKLVLEKTKIDFSLYENFYFGNVKISINENEIVIEKDNLTYTTNIFELLQEIK